MPSTVIGCASRTGHLLDVHVEIRRDFLDVVQVFQLLEQLHQRLGVLALDVHGRFRDEGHFGFDDADPRFLDRVLDEVDSMRIGRHNELIALGFEIFGATVERYLEDSILLVAGAVDVDLALAIKEIRDRVRRSQIASETGELVANLRYGARGVVTERGNEDRDASGTITLVLDFRIVNTFELTRSLLDGALDVFLGHRLRFRSIDRRAQPWISAGVAASDLGGHGDLTNQLRELRAPFRIRRGFVMLDLFPFTVTSHIVPPV